MSFRVTERPIEALYGGNCSYCEESRQEEGKVYNCEITPKKTCSERPCSNIDKLYCPLAGARGR